MEKTMDVFKKVGDIQKTFWGLPWWFGGLSIWLQCRRPGFNPWIGKILWRRKWQPSPIPKTLFDVLLKNDSLIVTDHHNLATSNPICFHCKVNVS